MPIKQSAKKALRQSRKRESLNRWYKDKMKAMVKETKKLIASGKIEEAKKLLPNVYKAFDKAAKKGVIKKNTAARRKSGIARLLK